VRIKAGNAPDVAYIPQPGLLRTLVEQNPGKVIPAGEAASANVDKYFNEDWKTYGTVDDTFYAVPLGANVKSFVWYSPSAFEEKGYKVPTTWDELMTLTAKIESDEGGDGLTKPWCAGIESGTATGWPATDWLEDLMLRTGTPEDLRRSGSPTRSRSTTPRSWRRSTRPARSSSDDKYVNGGLRRREVDRHDRLPGRAASRSSTAPATCTARRRSTQANWPEGTKVAEDGDVWAFYLPGSTPRPSRSSWWRVRRLVRRPSRGQGLPRLPGSPEWATRRPRSPLPAGCPPTTSSTRPT
jgi:alpha-glucoside transport system substrate-binding protein